ncbi:MAG: hypothetical protein ACLSHL_04450 [Alistipes communis]
MRGFFLVLGYLIGGGLSCGFAQPSYYANPFIEQIEHYPQEKLHVSTDKDSYIAGDTIWLRAHCADAATHRPVAASRYVYAELRDDRGSLVRRIKLLSRDSVYSGYLPTQSLERFGDYSLTAYTLYMRNQGARLFLQEAAHDLALSGEPQDAAQHLGAQSLGLRRLVLPRRAT